MKKRKFEEFRAKVPTVAAHEVEADSSSKKVKEALDNKSNPNPDDPRVRRHETLKELASLEEQRNKLEQSAVKMTVLGDEQAKARTREALNEIEDRRLECLARLHSDRKTHLEIFFSYAHEDESLRDELAKQLKLLQSTKSDRSRRRRTITFHRREDLKQSCTARTTDGGSPAHLRTRTIRLSCR